METSRRIIDYRLKGCMMEQKCKNTFQEEALRKLTADSTYISSM
jgi:hypothetical protein